MSMDRDPNIYDRETRVDDRDTTRGSYTLAYLVGGLVIALGLIAFLFYGWGNRDVDTTASTGTQVERPAAPVTPANPAAPAPAPAAPKSP